MAKFRNNGYGWEARARRLPPDIFDKLFKRRFKSGNAEQLKELLRAVIELACPELVGMLDMSCVPRALDIEFVTRGGIASRRADLVFLWRLLDGTEILVVIEHKATPDPGAQLQAIEYLLAALDREREAGREPLPLAIIVGHGPKHWPRSLELGDVLRCAHLSRRPRAELLRHGLARPLLVAMARTDGGALDDDELTALAEGIDLDTEDGLVFRDFALQKLAVRRQALYDRLLHLGKIDEVYSMLSELEQYVSEAWAAGETNGETKGVAKGKADTLLFQLEQRFGSLPLAAKARVRDATPEQLDGWLRLVLNAPSLEAMFGGPTLH